MQKVLQGRVIRILFPFIGDMKADATPLSIFKFHNLPDMPCLVMYLKSHIETAASSEQVTIRLLE
jgi:hypothetical protein